MFCNSLFFWGSHTGTEMSKNKKKDNKGAKSINPPHFFRFTTHFTLSHLQKEDEVLKDNVP